MGIFNFIKSALSGNNKASNNTARQADVTDITPIYSDIIRRAYRELQATGESYWWTIKVSGLPSYTDKLLPLPDKQKVAFILKAIITIHLYYKGRQSYSSADREFMRTQIANAFIRQLLKTRLLLDEEDLESITSTFFTYNMYGGDNVLCWPVNLLVSQVEKQVKERPFSEKLKQVLTNLAKKLGTQNNYGQVRERAKLIQRIDDILFKCIDDKNSGIKPTFFPGDDAFGQYANATIRGMREADQQQWFALMQQAQKATGSKPSKKYTDEIKNLFKDFGVDKYKQQVNEWFCFLIAMKEKTTHAVQRIGDRDYDFSSTVYLTPPNSDILKGFIWSCVHFHDKTTVFNIAQLAGRAFKKIPNQGATAAAIGNACIYVLANSKGLDGVGHLSRLKLRVQQSSTQNLVEKYLLEAAAKQGVSIHEIEDMAVDDHGLQAGKKAFDIDGYKAVFQVTGVGKTTLEWLTPDGLPQKSVPAIIREKQAARLKKIKDSIKQVELTTSGQRDRLDRMLKSTRVITGSKFKTYYFDHGLMSWLCHKIIWMVEKGGNKQALFFLDGKWYNSRNEEVAISMEDDTSFSLWHPVFETVASIKAWRDFMMQHKIVQPLKQAFREVYILTDAEITTLAYSNRMAAHILKQHQFNSLAKIRGWKYTLMGNFDGAGNEFASADLKEYGLRAEFWVNPIEAEDTANDTGIWTYVATDQLRFIDTATGTVKELLDIPAVLLSETLRDLDLFVGVASVGNDPNWRDSGGLPGYNDYWQSYSFGDLNELAKTRRSILEGLIPRLKIAHVAELKDKFLVVKGKLRTYKIHIGSTNILMEPNDQYLCIVPDRGKKDLPDNVFLPFEGDNGLSVILSKAMLLADDDKIIDKTITSQINRK